MKKHLTLFISYCHESASHQNKILGLANRLVSDGIDVILDQYVFNPAEGWQLWMDRGVRDADYVAMICTETYYRRVMGDEDVLIGQGVKWEGKLIYQHIYNNDSLNEKFLPCLLDGGQVSYIPTPLQSCTRYLIETEDGYEDFYRYITDQPRIQKPTLGKLRQLPAKSRQSDFMAPLCKKEVLVSNLLEVEGFFKKLYIAETEYRRGTIEDLWKKLDLLGISHESGWLLKEKRIVSIYDLREMPWREICDVGTVEEFESDEWALSDDLDKQKEFVWMLNNCLADKLRSLGLRFNKKFRVYYFLPTSKGCLKERKIRSGSTTETYKTVFKAYNSNKTPHKLMFCRHSAFSGYFQRYERKWYLEITPTYYFTRDGTTPDLFYEEKLSKLKRLENSDTVRRWIMSYARLLCGEDGLLEAPYQHLQFGKLKEFQIPYGIDDEQWLPSKKVTENDVMQEEMELFFNHEY